MVKARDAGAILASISKRLGLFVGMWLIPGPIIVPIGVYFFYKWRKRKKANEKLTQTTSSSSQTPL